MKKTGMLANVANFDGWINVLTGLGKLGKDKRMSASVQFSPMLEVDAENLYAGDDMAGKIVDLLPDEATKEPFSLTKFDDLVSKAILKEVERLQLIPRVNKAWKTARMMGGAGLFIATDDAADLSKPLRPNAKVTAFQVLSRWEIAAESMNIQRDLSKPDYGMPTLYRFQPRGASDQATSMIHASRVIRFDGAELPEHQRIQNQYWGDSELNKLFNAIRNYNTVHDSAASIMQDFRIAVFKIKDLANKIAEGNDDQVIKRLQLVDLARSIARAVVIDADGEDFEYRSGSVAGMPELITKAENRLVAGTKIPHTILLGESPGGSNSTGNSTTQAWYSYVSSQQQVYLKPLLRQAVERIMASLGLQPVDGWDIEFAPLWQMDEKEQAQVRKTQAETDAIYMDHGVIDAREVAVSRFGGKEYSTETQIDLSLRKALPPGQHHAGAAQVDKPAQTGTIST